MNSPIIWFGGKGLIRLKNKLLSHINIRQHEVYVEPFGGGTSILFAKKPSDLEVYNDINHALYEFFVVLSDSDLFEKFYRRVSVLPLSRELYLNCLETWKSEKDIVVRVSKWFVLVRQSFGGMVGTWKYSVRQNKAPKTWLNCLSNLPQVHGRLQRVQIECLDWSKIFEKYDSEEALFYCDPPYVEETRTEGGKNAYEYEMSNEEHKNFVGCLLGIKGQAIVSGYDHEIYDKLVKNGWGKYEIDVKITFPSKNKDRKEIVWATPVNRNKSRAFF